MRSCALVSLVALCVIVSCSHVGRVDYHERWNLGELGVR